MDDVKCEVQEEEEEKDEQSCQNDNQENS